MRRPSFRAVARGGEAELARLGERPRATLEAVVLVGQEEARDGGAMQEDLQRTRQHNGNNLRSRGCVRTTRVTASCHRGAGANAEAGRVRYSRTCRMQFMKHELPKLVRPRSPMSGACSGAAPSGVLLLGIESFTMLQVAGVGAAEENNATGSS